MALRVYSTRFVTNTAAGVNNFQVPPGKRAVVKAVSAMNVGAAAAAVYLNVGGPTVWSASVPASAGVAPPITMIVAYAGDLIGLVNQTSDLRSTVSGYLFDDPGLDRAPDSAVAVMPPGGDLGPPYGPT